MGVWAPVGEGPVGVFGSASAPASCGELAQGWRDGRRLLISCPIDLRVSARVTLVPGSGEVAGPAGASKARQAVALTLAWAGREDLDARLVLDSPVPRGKGMASSTADVIAAIGATGRALGRSPAPEIQAAIALRVEPSDSTMFPGLALLDYREGQVMESLGPAPPLGVLVLDWGGALDTLAFNRRDHEGLLQARAPIFREALEEIIDGVRTGDAGAIGRGATRSARAHQEILPKSQLEQVLSLAARVGGLGVTVAHSGTVIGLLMPDDPERMTHALALARAGLAGLTGITSHRVCDGGVS